MRLSALTNTLESEFAKALSRKRQQEDHAVMSTTKTVPAELLEQLRQDRERIAAELPELLESRQTT